MNRISGILCVFLAALFILSVSPANAERMPVPELLRIKQHSVSNANSFTKIKTCRTYPDTANAAVNRAVTRIVDWLAEEAEKRLPASVSQNGLADAGATVRVMRSVFALP